MGKKKSKKLEYTRKEVIEIVDEVMFFLSDNGIEMPAEEWMDVYYPSKNN